MSQDLEKDQEEKHFDDVFRAWADRPPPTAPAAAAQQVLERLKARESVRRPGAFHLLAAAAVVALGIAGAYRLRAPGPAVPGAPVTAATAAVATTVTDAALAAPLNDGVVLLWIDSETPLYMTFQPPQSQQGETP